jgi:broad specificity phosphatase PhoE
MASFRLMCLALSSPPNLIKRSFSVHSNSQTPDAITLYLIRHAQSSWNEAYDKMDHTKPEWFSFLKNPFPVLTENDHHVTDLGVLQCLSLQNRIVTAAKLGDTDANQMLSPSTIIASSPLTRAVVTAALTFTAGEHSTPNIRPLVLLPSARESDAHWFFGRDSIGTPKSKLYSRIENALKKHGAISPPLDFSILDSGSGDAWWSVEKETSKEMQARLDKILIDVFSLASRSSPLAPAVVLSTHSFVIRRLFAQVDRTMRLSQESIENCGCIAVPLRRHSGGVVQMGGPPRLLFDSKFASYSPEI